MKQFKFILLGLFSLLSCQCDFEKNSKQEQAHNSSVISDVPILMNRLDLPMASQKTLVAHFMTGDIDYDFGGRPGGLSRNLDWYKHDGEFSELGGVNQVAPMDMFLYKRGERSLDEVVSQELRAASVAGIEAFHFYYPEVNHKGFMADYNAVVESFFRVASKTYPHFKFTLCLSNANEGLEEDKIERWSESIRNLVESVRSYDHWLKTPDGRTIFYLWNNDALADDMNHKPWSIDQFPDRIKSVAEAHEKLAQAIGLEIAYMYDLRFPANHDLSAKVLEYFPGVWTWTDSTKHLNDFRRINKLCRVKKRDFCLTVYPDYYTSKLYWKDSSKGHSMLSYKDLKTVKVDAVERHYQNCALSLLYRELFEFALAEDLQWISLATWNDFPEGHHIAPEINHNFVPMVLMEYYCNQWKDKELEIKESISVFYKKYRHDIVPKYDVKIHTKERIGEEQLEDFIEVVSILDKPGEIYINGKFAGEIATGLQTVKLPSEVGPVSVELRRGSKPILSLAPPQKIHEQPYRTDRLTYMYSSRFDEYFEKIFGTEKSLPDFLKSGNTK
ncbi:hypothetical protein PQO03_06615 [Lentisphaera profundi]|uniref:Glycoside hydrolase family 42 N-terminal domain-containing protein n=1 Tax=Lentisphaera profundi TaxID=1658616 RepID=A0ABY7VMV7_9BACT|nr:hypothetical protein [Lentisphaera profundi]WDE95388.1 hypothetical protein PQO03_06615 [Lentisphaera profundi]